MLMTLKYDPIVCLPQLLNYLKIMFKGLNALLSDNGLVLLRHRLIPHSLDTGAIEDTIISYTYVHIEALS